MAQVCRVGIGFFEVAHLGIPRPPFSLPMAPGNRVILRVFRAVKRFIERSENLDLSARVYPPIVPFVGSDPKSREIDGSGITAILNIHQNMLPSRWVGLEVSPNEFGVPGPVVLGVGCGMDAHPALSAFDKSLHRLLLVVVENGSRGRREANQVVL